MTAAGDFESELVYGCDYCGRFTPVESAEISYTDLGVLADGRTVVALATHCSPFCARAAERASFPVGRG